jgi:hypothetical protein
MQSIQLATLNVDELRTRLRKMSDEELRNFGKAARYMVSPSANMGKPPLPTFVLQLVRGAEYLLCRSARASFLLELVGEKVNRAEPMTPGD